jgi:peptidoglycan/LPS O-acetylase OafA/YrhL
MGVLRFLLAFSVLGGHVGLPVKLLPGDAAVEVFYVISGFYMALVLNTNSAYSNPVTFLKQRALRLLPVYWAALLLTIAVVIALGFPDRWIEAYRVVDVTTPRLLAYLFSTLFILGQDAFMFLQVDPGGGISLQPHLNQAVVPAYGLLLVPQAWTLSLEMVFYAVAPFILTRSKRVLLALVALSVGTRLILVALGLHGEPWSYRFFPSELALFLTGALAYRLVTQPAKTASWMHYGVLVSLVMIAVILGRPEVGESFRFRSSFIAMWLLVLAIPFLFSLTRSNRLDKVIGELSYPLYISHMIPVIAAQSGAFGHPHPVVIGAAGLVLAGCFYLAIDMPVERFRHRLLTQPMTSRASIAEAAPLGQPAPDPMVTRQQASRRG